MKIAITGGRDYILTPVDWIWLAMALQICQGFGEPIEVLHGDAPGVDSSVAHWLVKAEFPYTITPYPADWKTFGNAAGPIRNGQMAKACDLVLAFPGGTGTSNMIKNAKIWGKEVRESPTRTKP